MGCQEAGASEQSKNDRIEVRGVTMGQVIWGLVSHCELFGSHSGDLRRNGRVLSRGVN